MKIVHVCPRYHPHVGGVEYVVKSVVERLARRGHEVNVLCGEQGMDKPREEVINGVSVIRWPVWSPREAYHIPRMRSSLKLWLLKSVKDCDIVHFHSVHSVLAIYSLRVLRDSGVHKVLTPHYHGTGHTFLRRMLWKVWRKYIKSALTCVDVVHSVSRFEADLLTRDFSVQPVIIEHGVEEWLSEVKWDPSGYVMYSGRIEKYKNIHRLANIVKMLNDHGFNLELKVFGEGSFKSKLEQHLKKLGVKHELKPPQPYEEYINHLSKASLFGLLSEKEAYGQTVNEANAIGTPVVIARPWGTNFSGRNRTLIVDLRKDDCTIADEIKTFIKRCAREPQSKVPSWSAVVGAYVKHLYGGR